VYLFAYEPEGGDRLTFFERFGFEELPEPEEGRPSTSLPFPMCRTLEGTE
jgi:hypothetical protein